MARGNSQAPCHGRTAELNVLDEVLRRVAEGHFAGVIVEGEPGIGKSRLLAEALAHAKRVGLASVNGRAEELEQTRPFGVLTDAFRCEPSSPDPRRVDIYELLSPGAGEHAGLTVTSDPGLQFQVVDRFLDLVEALSLSRPLVIWIDDLQWADPASLSALDTLTRRLTYLPVAVLVGLRPTPRSEAVQRLLATLTRADTRRMTLAPLEGGDVNQLVAETVGGRSGPGLLRQVSGAGGNPLFILELVRALVDADALRTVDGQVEVTQSGLPPDLRLTILQRLSFLSDDTLGLLRSASVLGSAFPLADLSTLVSRSAFDLSDSLQGAFRAGVLVDDGDRVRFGHDLVRDAIYSDLPRGVRVALHREAGQRLAAAGAPARRVAGHLARFAEPGDREAVAWLTRAAGDAAGSPGVAADLLERAVELSSATDPDRDVLLAERAGKLLWAGRLPEAESVCRTLLDRPGAHQEIVDVATHALLGRCLMAAGRMEEAVVEFERAQRSPLATDAERAASSGAASTAHLFAGHLDAAAAAAAQARAAADRGTNRADQPDGPPMDDTVASTARKAEATVALFRGHLSQALRLIDEAVACADASPARQGHRDVHHLVRGHTLLELDRLPEARATLETGMRLGEELGTRWSLSAYQLMLAVERYTAGEWDQALAEVDAGLELTEETGERYNVVVGHCLRSLIAFHRNDLAGADSAAAAANQELARSGPRYRSHWTDWTRALLLEADGAAVDAHLTLARCWDGLAMAGTAVEYAAVGPDLVRWARRAGDRRRGEEVVAALEAVAALNEVGSLTGAALRCRGLWEDDPAILRAAVDAYADSPRPLERALACEDAGTLLGRSGDRPAAIDLLQRSVAIYDQLEAHRDAARATATLRSLGVRRGPRAAHSRARMGWDSLTPSEVTVVELVAEGLSNPQIGERLFVSRRTVQTHLAHVFAKLEISTRSELAAASARRNALG